jgi:hypothetical protein
VVCKAKISKRFVKIFLFFFGGLVMTVAAINVVIDPFTLFQTPSLSKMNEIKTILFRHERLYKAIEIARKKPQAVLFGSSRILEGFDPRDIETLTGIETYNGAFSAANMEEIYHYFEHTLYHQPHLKVVVIGLDFEGFSQTAKPHRGFRLDRLKGSTVHWGDLMRALFSWKGLKESYETFKENYFLNPIPLFLQNGKANPELEKNPEDRPIVRRGELAYLKYVLQTDYKDYQIDEAKLEMFQKMVETCKERAIELKVFFNPLKAIYWGAIHQSQLWSIFEDLKRRLCAIYPIWDFSGFNCVTTQALEQEINQSLYHECSHFRSIVGKMIGEKMFDKSEYPHNFGFLLTSQTIENALAQMRQQAQDWLATRDNLREQIEKAKEWVD